MVVDVAYKIRKEWKNNGKRNPNTQTAATKKYHEKIGYISKSYKLSKEIAEAFKETCAEEGVSQASKLAELMMAYYPIGQRK
ncbi:MAG: chemotaxis protein [Roseburia sp.]